MLSFKQYLIEVARSPERAAKLGGYVAKRQYKYGSNWNDKYIRFPKFNVDHEENYNTYWGNRVTHHSVPKDTPVHYLPVHTLKPSQPSTSFRAGDHKQEKKFNDTNPIRVAKIGDQHFIMNGHHRWVAHKLLGKKKIAAYVYDVDEADWARDN